MESKFMKSKMAIALIASMIALPSMAKLGEGIGVLKGDENTKEFSAQNREKILRNQHKIVLTFDDGPTPGVTDKVLDLLKQYNIKGSFFVIGNNVKSQPALMKRMVAEGHLVANHTMSHPNLTELGFFWRKKLKEEVLGAHNLLNPYLSNNKRLYFRAPMGAWESKLAGHLNNDQVGAQYIGPLLWDIGGEMKRTGDKVEKAADWACWAQNWSVDECLQGYLTETLKHDGGVILMHDLRGKSVELLAKYLEETTARGFQFLTLDEIDL